MDPQLRGGAYFAVIIGNYPPRNDRNDMKRFCTEMDRDDEEEAALVGLLRKGKGGKKRREGGERENTQ